MKTIYRLFRLSDDEKAQVMSVMLKENILLFYINLIKPRKRTGIFRGN